MMTQMAADDLYGEGPNEMSPGLTIGSIMKEMKGIRDKFKNEDDDFGSPFQGLEKASVLQDCRDAFNDANVVTNHPRKCCVLITKLMHILNRGETFTSTETSEVFFGVTKLFQSKDANLRRMVYLFIKEVAETTAADEVIIVTQSLTKDMNSDTGLYRANAIRVLSKIIDGSMLGAIDRYIKQAVVDRNPLIASSALVSGLHLIGANSEIIRRWVNQVQEAVSSNHMMVQYHALSLLYSIKQHDRLAVSKLVTQLSRNSLQSPLAVCQLVRYTARLLREDLSANDARAAYQFLESCLRHKKDMVVFEATRAICNLPNLDANDLSPAITCLQLFLSSPKPVLRFGAMRLLNKVAQTNRLVVAKCNDDMETLISDSNRSVATLAITTLLKTGAESNVDRLMKQISSFMGDIADDFKIVVVDAIRSLCLRYPQKYRVLLNFLANFLREEGGFEFKRTITDAILEIMNTIPEARSPGLFHLCEFIEDCEFTSLSVKVLYVLGQVGPSTPTPARFIRFIYNRIILENAAIRASAVSSLAEFAVKLESLRPGLLILLRRCLQDEDDEVRDRAATYVNLLEKEEARAQSLLLGDLPVPVENLQYSLQAYLNDPKRGPLSFESLPVVEVAVQPTPSDQRMESSIYSATKEDAVPEMEVSSAADLYQMPQFAHLGKLFRSTRPVELTESETEYVVSVVKHIFDEHVVLQYNVKNTMEDQLLKNVGVTVELSEPDVWEVQDIITIDSLKCGEPGSCYVLLSQLAKPDLSQAYSQVTLSNVLNFKVFDVDPQTGEADDDGFEEEYPLEDFDITAADFMTKIGVTEFKRAWEQMGDANEVREGYALQIKSLSEAVSSVIDYLGMQACENTGTVLPTAKQHHMLLSGIFIGGVKVLVRCQLSLDNAQGVTILKMAVRSGNGEISQLLADCIG